MESLRPIGSSGAVTRGGGRTMTAWFPQHKFVMSCLRGPFSIAACSPGETRAPAKRLWFPSLGRIPADDMTTTLPQCTTRFPGNIFWANS